MGTISGCRKKDVGGGSYNPNEPVKVDIDLCNKLISVSLRLRNLPRPEGSQCRTAWPLWQQAPTLSATG